MKQIVIIEDETIAAQNLQRLLSQIDPQMRVVRVLQSVEESVEYFSTYSMPDLLFLDIHLADGSAFRIFDKVCITCPIIFTTAFDQYALDAFKVNSVDYLLKPINNESLSRALSKLERLCRNESNVAEDNLMSLVEAFKKNHSSYRRNYLVPVADKLVPVSVEQLAYFYLDEKITRAVTFDEKQIAFDKPLDVMMGELDPRRFFRANRQFVVAHDAISEISVWPIGKLKLTLKVTTPEPIIVSRARTSEFKQWYVQ